MFLFRVIGHISLRVKCTIRDDERSDLAEAVNILRKDILNGKLEDSSGNVQPSLKPG